MNPLVRMMKRYINMPLKKALPLLFVSVILLVSITGCTSQQTTTQSSNGTAATTGGITATAKAVTMPAVQHTVTPTPSNKYIAYNATVTNVNAKGRSISYAFWTLRDTNGTVYTPSWLLGDAKAINQFDGVSNSQPGDVVKGLLVYNVPQTIQAKSLTYDDGTSTVVITL
jgi:ABC-type Fe3+-hydroxamate transport system substrate-binding protein